MPPGRDAMAARFTRAWSADADAPLSDSAEAKGTQTSGLGRRALADLSTFDRFSIKLGAAAKKV
jgi:hypothetical protein